MEKGSLLVNNEIKVTPNRKIEVIKLIEEYQNNNPELGTIYSSEHTIKLAKECGTMYRKPYSIPFGLEEELQAKLLGLKNWVSLETVVANLFHLHL